MKMIRSLILASSLLVIAQAFAQNNEAPASPSVAGVKKDLGWTFETVPVFSDEFNYSGSPDTTKWSYDIGGSGWGNNELQYYTDQYKNASVAGGILTITALKEDVGGKNYTSARMVTKYKGDILYGRVEVKAQVPAGTGTWPAIWMLPTDWVYGGWPKSGEIDIMEHVGYDPNVIHFSTHCEAYYFWLKNQKTAVKKIAHATTRFHTYRMDWTPYAIRGYYDGKLVFTNVNEGTGPKAWPFDQRFHLLLNVAVGGDWGGAKGLDEKAFPASMKVDYVRFYKMIDK